MTDFKKYIKVVGITLLILTGIFVFCITMLFGRPDILLILRTIIFTTILICILISSITICRVEKGIAVNRFFMKVSLGIVKIIFPVITFISDIFGIDKSGIRREFIKLNNSYIMSGKYKIDRKDILVLIPHCIQFHSCRFRVTSTIENCQKCGLCNISELAEIGEKQGVNVFIATGGTLARKVILDNRPKAVIAVACERDLTSGIKDVKGIPVIGVFNERPNGPCFDTRVNVKNIEKAISFFEGNT